MEQCFMCIVGATAVVVWSALHSHRDNALEGGVGVNGVHDMGGMAGFGPVIPEPVTPAFHSEWEKRVFGLVVNLISRQQKWDEFRFAIERIQPSSYLASSYYERWLTALEGYLVETGVIGPRDLAPATPLQPKPTATKNIPYAEVTSSSPRFRPGDRVITRNINPPWHTRLPRYARGKRGVIHRSYGLSAFADSNSAGLDEKPQPIYSVRISARELWGDEASERDGVYLDLWESYLQEAS
jgi:nitrile hydratase